MKDDNPGEVNSPKSSRVRKRARLPGYLLAVVVTIVTLMGRLAFASWFGARPALVLFVLPIFLSAYAGGLGPGLVSTAVFALGSAYFLMPPVRSFAMDNSVDTVLWLVLILIGVLISVLTESLHVARRSDIPSAVHGTSLTTERKVQGGFGFALLFLAVIGAVSIFSVSRLREDTGWATHTEEVISALRQLSSTMADAETAEHDYIITGDENYLQPYGRARLTLDGELAGLRKLTADNPVQQQQLDKLEPQIAERLVVAERNIALRRSQQFSVAQTAQMVAEGKPLYDRSRELIAQMDTTEQHLLRERQDRVNHTNQVTRSIIIFGGSLAFVFVAVALFVMKQEFAVRRRAEMALREARDNLEARVQERTTALERINGSLRESEELFSKAFRLSPDCLAIIRLEDRTVIRANEAVCRMWGSTPENVIGKPTKEYTSWVSEDERSVFVQTIKEKGECLNHEATLRMNDGRLVRFNISSRVISLSGEPCVLSLMSDITERKRTEAAAVRLAAIVEYSEDAIIGKDLEGVVTSWNAGAEKIFGYTADEMLGQSITRLIPLDRLQEEVEILGRLRKGENIRSFETVRRCKDGRTLEVSITTSAINDASGRVIGASKIVRDIAERKKAEKSIRESETRYRTLFEYAPDGIVIANPKSYYLDANASMCRMLGYTRDELIGLHASDIVAEAEIQHIGAALHTLNARSDYHREWQFRRKDGTTFPAEVIATVMPDGNLLGMIRDVTERKQAERAVREGEEQFQTLANSIPQLAWIARADGYIVWYNQRWYEYTGTTPEQMQGWNWQSVHDPELFSKVLERWTAAINSGEPLEMEFPLRGADGRFRAFLTRVQPLKDAAGRVVKWFGTNTDVEALKQAETALRESEAYFRFLNDLAEAIRTLADPAQIMAVTAQMLGEHLHASRCAYADVEKDGERFNILHDYTDGCASTVGNYQLSLFGPQVAATLHRGQTLIIRNVDAELLPGEGADMFNAIGIKAIITCPLVKEGHLRAMMAVHQATSRDWKTGEIAIVRDVVERCWATIERRTAEEKINQLNADLEQRVIERTEELADLYNNAPCGYHSLNSDGVFLGINDTELTWLGYAREDVVEKMNATDLLTPPSVKTFRENYSVLKTTGRLDNLELAMVRKDGSILPVLLSATIATDRSGRFLRSRSTIIDYTGRKQAEVILQESQTRLEAANKELEAFSYSVSHDLRTPLRAMDGFSQAVLEDFGEKLPVEGRHQLQTIRESAQRMGDLIDDLLTFSRLGRQTLRKQSVDMDKLVRSAFGELQSQQGGRQSEVDIGDLPVCQGDPALLKQVWINLLSNALKYTRKRDHPLIEVGCTRQNEEVVYFVRDNGAGFDMRYAHKLFGVFQRLHRAEDYEGTGVGLAIVQRIIHRHGGRVWADSLVDAGATFQFTLNGETKA